MRTGHVSYDGPKQYCLMDGTSPVPYAATDLGRSNWVMEKKDHTCRSVIDGGA